MKNLIIYISPQKDFNQEYSKLVKVQIDNSLDLGWKKEDIILVTNFKYKYNGIQSLVVGDENYCQHAPSVSKTYTLISLFKMNLINPKELYWIHDLDNYQLQVIDEKKIRDELGDCVVALQDYGATRTRWSTGSIFFNSRALKVFEDIKKFADEFQIVEEKALCHMGKDGFKKINHTYNFTSLNIRTSYRKADKPIVNIHFHPTQEMINFFMYGKNQLSIVLMTDRLIKIFKKYYDD